MKFVSLKFQIPFTILIFALSSIIITVVLLDNVTSKHLKDDVLETNLGICEMIGEQIYLYLENARDTVDTAAKFASESYGDMEQIKNEIFRIYDNFQYFDLIFFINSEGNMLFSKPENEYAYISYNYKDRDYFQNVMKTSTSSISNLHVSRVLGELHFIIASPVYNVDNQIVGLIGAGVPLINIEGVVKAAQKNFDGRIYIVDSQGTLLIHPDINNIKSVLKLEDNPISSENSMENLLNIMKNKESTTLNYQRENVKYHSAISFVKEVNWMIIAEQSEETILKDTIWLKKSLKLITIGVVLSVIIIGLLFAQKITKPLERLVKEVSNLSHDYGQVNFIDIQSNNEIGKLAKAFNDMSVKLKDNINRLNNSYKRENYYRQYLDNILKSLASGILVIDEKEKITIFNNAAEKITGFSKEEYIGKNIESLFKKLNLKLEKMIKSVANGETQSIFIERTIINKKGKKIPINLHISPVVKNGSQIMGIIFLFNDISSIKKLEEELSKMDRMHILGELSASLIHDIGNPLAGMKNLLELAEENLHDKELTKNIYDMLNKEIEELNDLVVNYLSFSKNTSIDREYTDIFELMDNVINLLRPEIINKNINLSKNYINKKYAKILINKNNVKHALINILLNCIQASNEGGIVSVKVVAEENEVKITIKDNGIGIKEENINKIFEPFYTTKKGGTGLGLSSAYKIIKEHKGHINVKSKFGCGTQFDIVLKKIGDMEGFHEDISN